MNEPIRLRDLGGEGTELLRAARRPRALPPEVRARTAAKVAAMAATPVAVGAAAKWLTGKTLAWLLGFGVLGAAIGIGAYAMRGNPTGVTHEEPQISHAPPPVVVPIIEPAQPTVAPKVVETAPVVPKPSAKSSADTLAEENALLDPARGKVDSDAAGVLAAADAHRKKFPNGQLAADREYLAVRALKKLGRDDEAKTRGGAFLERFPQSPYAMYVRKLIQ